MKIVFAIAEADPFIKTGGLGEVGGSLPAALQGQGADVCVIMPKYSEIPEHFRRQFKPITHFPVPVAWRRQYCGLEEMNYRGIRYYFIDNEYYFKRTHVYGEYDEAERYAFFARAVLESLLHLPEFKPDIIHCHDWHTALIPLMLKEFYNKEPLHYSVKTVFTIHNLKYQGIFPHEVLDDVLGLDEKYFREDRLEFHGAVNFMKAGLLYADRITTVSPTYAQEIQDPFYGERLDGVLRQRRDVLAGILNGIDYEVYNPETDRYLAVPFSASPRAKEENKQDLQRSLGLPPRRGWPLLGMVSRLVDQKGLDLVLRVLEEILRLDVQLVILGRGERKYEEELQAQAGRHPEKFALRREFNDELGHKIFAGSDLLLMPSRFEPCGIAQMMAMRYGTLPVVRETGGLKDTVKPYNEFTGDGDGFSFGNYNAHEFLFTVERAVRLYYENKPAWNRLKKQAFRRDFSWDKSAKAYVELYRSLL
ncbi:starch synthase (glycosyl-transferring) [Acididesulfobacillus acetoxydans]|uniref:Glycogen synthase n=1 Tax=Acididesulfobacillus acetoxydans TaxID=1561005 RepID=A0A8S0X0U8_9FIRM|nr:glycogen synthase GlgA [Acididesulfobacillus acetoxydans]CAA7602781.1 starch synthase (glycosyl-transferring) [Acididesulfobacillus acetoxydans]CEJ06362.1 Glycogen synthase [Acididesulfobacillus acetoxydans]